VRAYATQPDKGPLTLTLINKQTAQAAVTVDGVPDGRPLSYASAAQPSMRSQVLP